MTLIQSGTIYHEYICDDTGTIYNTLFQDTPAPLSLEVYDKNSVSISGSSSPYNFAKFRMRFGRTDSSSGNIPLAYSKFFSLGSSWFTDSANNWNSLDYDIKLNMSGYPFDTPSYFSQWSGGEVLPSPVWLGNFTPRSYTKYLSGSTSPFGFSNARQIGYSDAHSWSYWLGVPNGGTLSEDSSSDLFYKNYAAACKFSDTEVDLSWSMGDNDSDVYLSIDSEDTINFSSAYNSAVSTGLQDFYFGLTLDDSSLANLNRSLVGSYVVDTYDFDDYDFSSDFHVFTGVSNDRSYEYAVDPTYSYDSDLFSYGVYYYLIPVDSNGNELSSYTIGPYLFNQGQNLYELLDLSYDYKIRLAVYIRDFNIKLRNFTFPSGVEWAREGIPYSLQKSSSSAYTNFGTSGDMYCILKNLSGFVVTPTVYADGVTNSDILDSFNSNFTSLKDILDQGFGFTISGLNSINNNITSSTASINSSISSASTSINNQLIDSTNKVNQSIEDSTDEITNGYDSSDMDKSQQELDSSLKDLDSVEDKEITDPDGNKVSFFEYIKSVFSSWSWPSFTTEFTNALTEISQLLNSIYSSLPEPFQTVIMFLILFTVLAIVLNFYKYYRSG